jgi:hypothetical protein
VLNPGRRLRLRCAPAGLALGYYRVVPAGLWPGSQRGPNQVAFYNPPALPEVADSESGKAWFGQLARGEQGRDAPATRTFQTRS